MNRTLGIYITLNLLLICSGCASISKANMKSQSHYIKLQLSGSGDTLQVYNDYVKMYFDYSDMLALLNKNSTDIGKSDFIEHLKKNSEPIFLESNMLLKTFEQEAIFPVTWKLLKEGKAKVFYNRDNGFVNEIEHVKINDFSGEQEYFRIIGGDIFLRKIITIGE